AQGFVTRRVAPYLNLAGLAAIALLAWDLFAPGAGRALPDKIRQLLALALAATLALLFFLYPRLDALLDPHAALIRDEAAFRPLHRLYLWISTIQWACALALLGLTVAARRREDRALAP